MATLQVQTRITYQTRYRVNGNHSNREVEEARTAGYVELAKQVCRQAIKDAMHHPNVIERTLAAAWLMDEMGLNMLEATGFDTNLIIRWCRAGCPAKKQEV